MVCRQPGDGGDSSQLTGMKEVGNSHLHFKELDFANNRNELENRFFPTPSDEIPAQPIY